MTLSRRGFLAGTCAAGAGGLLIGSAGAAAVDSGSSAVAAPAVPAFTFVHLTDQHVTHRRHAPDGYRKCIAAINELAPAADFVLMGGDMVFDGGYTAKDDYQNQIRLFKEITREQKCAWNPCVGNHDVLGWGIREKG